MLTCLLKILSILGILLLVLLGICLAALLLALFFPITYRLEASRYPSGDAALKADDPDDAGEKTDFVLRARVKLNWLFGFLRVRYSYPQPGKATAKILWMTLYDSSAEKKPRKQNKPKRRSKASKASKEEESSKAEKTAEDTAETRTEAGDTAEVKTEAGDTAEAREEARPETVQCEGEGGSQARDETQSGESPKGSGILKFFEKIRCTIQEICAKIKKIWEEIAYYKELLTCDDTRQLLNHVSRRFSKILKNIRPRKLKADIHFGTGSPDTTGYALGIYGMMSPHLGRHVNITPDFTQAVLEGKISASGHITFFQLLRHGVMLILDKRLRQLVKKLKRKDNEEEKNG